MLLYSNGFQEDFGLYTYFFANAKDCSLLNPIQVNCTLHINKIETKHSCFNNKELPPKSTGRNMVKIVL